MAPERARTRGARCRRPLPMSIWLGRCLVLPVSDCQLFDALPLAAEPAAAALDLVLTFTSSDFARLPGIRFCDRRTSRS